MELTGLDIMNALILISHDSASVTPTDEAQALIEDALSRGALIGQVRDADENKQASEAQAAIKAVRKQIEAAYRAAKDPIVDLGRKLDATFRKLVEELDREDGRIGQLAGEFLLAERRRAAAAEAAAKAELEKLEREKMQALAATSDPVKQTELLQEFSHKQAQQAPAPVVPAAAKGQKLAEDWDISLTNVVEFVRWVFSTGRWECMDVTVRKTAVKEILKGGVSQISGLECKKVAKATTQLPRPQKAIDV